MFRLLKLVLEHTTGIINYFTNEKVHFGNLLRISWESPITEINFCENFWRN